MESERVVQEALNRVMLERTTIIVAHRLSTVKNADVISVLQHGKMVEQGITCEIAILTKSLEIDIFAFNFRKYIVPMLSLCAIL